MYRDIEEVVEMLATDLRRRRSRGDEVEEEGTEQPGRQGW
jgi:hypothetical protein